MTTKAPTRAFPIVSFVWLILCVISSCVSLDAQTPTEPPRPTDKALNSLSSPVKLTTFPNGYELTNISKKKINQYGLGCVTEKNGKLTILQRLPVKHSSINPGEGIGSATIDAREFAIHECIDKRESKIAVLQVQFADGTVWRLWEKPLPPIHTSTEH